MDPVTALGCAAAAVQFLQFSLQILETCRQIREGAERSTQQNKDLEQAVRTVKDSRHELEASQKVKLPKRIADITRECIQDSDELIRVLERVRGAGKSIDVWKAALRTMRERKTIEKLRNSLHDKQQTLDRLLLQGIWTRNELTAVEQRADFENLDWRVQNLVQKLLDVSQNIAHLDQSTHARFNQHEKQMSINFKQAKLQADARQRETEQNSNQRQMKMEAQRQHEKLLTSLFFNDMDVRRATIKDAAPNTLRWIFDEKSNLGARCDDFKAWLRDDAATCYWIYGKPGSGKSTLMAHLVDDPRTSQELMQWSLDLKLHVLSFYFWRPGSPLQKSILGLLRSLLYQICQAKPRVVPAVLSHLKTTVDRLSAWTERSLRSTIINAISTIGGAKFCIFIDGLDEYIADEGYDNLVGLIFDLANLANAKCCVSSRPEAYLDRSFGTCQRLCLEDLNHTDIKSFVQQQLQTTDLKSEEKVDLARKITRRAEGVFLWASLVTREMLNAVIAGDDMAMLYRRLEAVPSKMEDLFRAMLTKVDQVHRKWFAFHLKTFEIKKIDSLCSVTCLAAAEMDTHIDSLDEFRRRCRQLEIRVNSRSAGLLQIRGGELIRRQSFVGENEINISSESPQEYTAFVAGQQMYYRNEGLVEQLLDYEDCYIDYVHRSAHDFIHSIEGRHMLGEHFPSNIDVIQKLWTGAHRYLTVAPFFLQPEIATSEPSSYSDSATRLRDIMHCIGGVLRPHRDASERDTQLQILAINILDDIRQNLMDKIFPEFLVENDLVELRRGVPPQYTTMELFWTICAETGLHWYIQSNLTLIRNHPSWQAALVNSLHGDEYVPMTKAVTWLRPVADFLAQRLQMTRQVTPHQGRISTILRSDQGDATLFSSISFTYQKCESQGCDGFQVIADLLACAALTQRLCPEYGEDGFDNEEEAIAWKAFSEENGLSRISQSIYIAYKNETKRLHLQTSAVDLPLLYRGRLDMVRQQTTRMICFLRGRIESYEEKVNVYYGYWEYSSDLSEAIAIELDPSTSLRIFKLIAGQRLANRLWWKLDQVLPGSCPEWFLDEIDEWFAQEARWCRALVAQSICVNVQSLSETDLACALAFVMLAFEKAVNPSRSAFPPLFFG